MMISCAGTGAGEDEGEKLDRLMEYLEPDRFIEYLDPPRQGVQSTFINILSMSTVDLLKEALADLLLASCGEILNEDLGDAL